MNYIGVDCHISSLDFAVVNEKGTTTKRQRVNTGVKELIGFIKSVPKPKKVIIEERESGGKVYSRKLTRNYNRHLKNAIKQATEAAIIAKDNQFRRQYLRLTIEKGIASHRAKLTVARSILAHRSHFTMSMHPQNFR